MQRNGPQYPVFQQSGSKNWRVLAIPRTIPIDSTRDVQTMHTIQIGTKRYEVGEPMAARLLSEASRLASEGRIRVSRGLISLALKIENGQLTALGSNRLSEAAQVAA